MNEINFNYFNFILILINIKLDEELLYDVLVIADLYMLPSLKRKCASELIAHHLNKKNLFDLFKLARLFDLKKMEFTCITFLAIHFFEVLKLINSSHINIYLSNRFFI